MRKTALTFALVIYFAPSALGLEIKARVISAEGKPVVAAVILHRPSGAKTQTDEKGYFSLSVPDAAKVNLEVIHPEYLEEEISLSAKDLARPITITLVPYIRQREEIVVTAMRYPEPSSKVPAAGTVLSSEALRETMAANVAQALQEMPGVARLGSGGFSLVPSIRGLGRRRVLLMVDQARLSSDRRTGPSASFVSPEDIQRIEVLRSPSSVFYGSDAIGGVVHILTRVPEAQGRVTGRMNTRYGTINQEKGLGFSL
ncbi:MAG: TonB-dependent receptor plug domain-containing protein, partial [Acidobacteriota bacterium]